MKVNEVSMSSYNYKRICVVTTHDTKYYPEDSEEAVIREHGECEMGDEPYVDDVGWLVLRIK